MSDLQVTLQKAVSEGDLLEASAENILFLLEKAGCEDWEKNSVMELIDTQEWTELNDRFYQTLKFGTGGLRGRTIGRVVTSVERGESGNSGNSEKSGPPQYPAAGTNVMNYFNLGRATQGLLRYVQQNFPSEQGKVVLAHDTRYFSRRFAEFAAELVSSMGGVAYLFEQERSTPELSFAVRHLGAHAGAMITASHNPPHDNGFKVYFQDGAQIVEPHASAIVKEVLATPSAKPENAPGGGEVISIGREVDEAYLNALEGLVIDAELLRNQARELKVVFTPIHGTGLQSIPDILKRFGVGCDVVPSQAIPDGGFPTVESPNPEYAEALSMAIERARVQEAGLAFGTDPDADRMGVAVRSRDGEYQLLSGNQIGSILAAYRLERLFEKGVLNDSNRGRAALIKTFVTTDLQKAIAEHYQVKCVDTLTGFKFIGEKLKDYEAEAGGRGDQDRETWRSTLLEKSTYFVFGGEESYGYLAEDYTRDKDANAAVLMLVEVAAWLSLDGRSLIDYLDSIYIQFGYYRERLGTLTFEGAEGAAKIKSLLQSYESNPPAKWGEKSVEKIQNFNIEDLQDVDGKEIPKQLMLMFYLSDGFRVAVRASGTEPKIKYYFFGRSNAADPEALSVEKSDLGALLDELWSYTQQDVKERVGEE
ncbi:MAG: phospho-sugar mutase [Verrucomicrobiota bacterium]